LKAAWADPVLYGGRGERTGADLDILVLPSRFEAFAAQLLARGRRRHAILSRTYERYFGHKEWSFFDPRHRVLPVDLHRELADPIWFALPADELLARATAYPSPDGEILSLSPEDQLLYAAVHYANHLYRIEGQHLEDCRRLLERFPITWSTVGERARRAHLELALTVVLAALQARGVAVPWRPGGRLLRMRHRLLGHWVTGGTVPRCRDGGLRTHLVDFLVLRPLLSDRIDALPRIVVRFGLPWVRERLTSAPRASPRA
jgi:hypothetical protein